MEVNFKFYLKIVPQKPTEKAQNFGMKVFNGK